MRRVARYVEEKQRHVVAVKTRRNDDEINSGTKWNEILKKWNANLFYTTLSL